MRGVMVVISMIGLKERVTTMMMMKRKRRRDTWEQEPKLWASSNRRTADVENHIGVEQLAGQVQTPAHIDRPKVLRIRARIPIQRMLNGPVKRPAR